MLIKVDYMNDDEMERGLEKLAEQGIVIPGMITFYIIDKVIRLRQEHGR